MARDKVGDILVGYSVSSASTYPAIAIAGRTVNDPPGTLESEVTVVHGTGSQLGVHQSLGRLQLYADRSGRLHVLVYPGVLHAYDEQ